MAEHTIDDLYAALRQFGEMLEMNRKVMTELVRSNADLRAEIRNLKVAPRTTAERSQAYRDRLKVSVTKNVTNVTTSVTAEHGIVTKPVTECVTQPGSVTKNVTIEHENVTASVTNPPYKDLLRSSSGSLFPENEVDRSLGESLREPGLNVTTSVTAVFEAYRASIQPKARLIDAAKVKIANRLRTFGELELLEAVRRFAGDNWQMEHNGWRGAAWFFDSDKRIEDYVNLPSRNGHGMTKFEHGMKVISATKPTELPDNSSNWAPTGEPNEWKLLMLQL